jgi:DNA-binding XRE family transcriptional regulator
LVEGEIACSSWNKFRQKPKACQGDLFLMGHGKQERPKKLAEKLLKIRKKLGLSQTGMAEALEKQGVNANASYIARYESEVRVPGLLIVRAYAKIAGVSMEQIVGDELDLPAKYK